MKKYLLINCAIAFLGIFTSCDSEGFLWSQTEDLSEIQIQSHPSTIAMKSAAMETESACEPTRIPLLHKNEVEVGSITISNNHTHLLIQIVNKDEFEIDNVQIWVGNKLSTIPTNRNYQPQPGRFPYKLSDLNKYSLVIPQTDIGENYYFSEGKILFISTHVELININSGEKKSAWSAGELLNSKNGATYPEYNLCIPTGGGGCFPHFAYCGQKINGNFYFNNTQPGIQDIVADNEDSIGTARYEAGKIILNFSQDWSFYGTTPVESIYGCDTPGGTRTQITAGSVSQAYEDFYFSVLEFPYYVIKLNVQHCTTNN